MLITISELRPPAPAILCGRSSHLNDCCNILAQSNHNVKQFWKFHNLQFCREPCLPPWGKVAPQGRMRGACPPRPVCGQQWQGCPSSVTFGDSFPLGGKPFALTVSAARLCRRLSKWHRRQAGSARGSAGRRSVPGPRPASRGKSSRFS